MFVSVLQKSVDTVISSLTSLMHSDLKVTHLTLAHLRLLELVLCCSLHPSSPILPFAFPVLPGTGSLLSFSFDMELPNSFEEHSCLTSIIDHSRINDHASMNDCFPFSVLSLGFIITFFLCTVTGFFSLLPFMNLMLTVMLFAGSSISFRG